MKAQRLKSQATTYEGGIKQFNRIKKAADSVDITGMTKDEADTARLEAALGVKLEKPKRLTRSTKSC